MIDVLVCVGVCVCIQPKRLIKLEKIRENKKIKKVKDLTLEILDSFMDI